jgi:NAD(P)-dependent dehydrogenase (short-subunit alcohol dehydrogenase family)
METMKGQVALVTGAASGMGLAAAKAFAEAGATVVLIDINEPTAGHQAISIRCDVADEQSVKAAVEQVVATYGRLDAAFNNAGIQSPAVELADVTGEVYDSVLSINLRGVWNFMKYELQQMRKQGSGAIVNNSSLGGLVGVPGRAAYHASKHGIIGLTKSAALEYATRGMVEHMLQSEAGAMEEMMKVVPMGRLGRSEEIADTVLWLCSSKSSFITGQAIAVDGGYTVQ